MPSAGHGYDGFIQHGDTKATNLANRQRLCLNPSVMACTAALASLVDRRYRMNAGTRPSTITRRLSWRRTSFCFPGDGIGTEVMVEVEKIIAWFRQQRHRLRDR